MNRKLRILWSANAVFAKSGYSNQSRDILYRLLKEGWNVAQSAFYGLEGGVIELNGLKIYPKLGDAWGGDAMVKHSKDYKADMVISFQDSWVLNPNYLRQTTRYTPYVPVDHDPIPPSVLERMKLAYRIITYSKFGQTQLENKGFASTYIPHGVDLDVFKPMDQKESRQYFGLPQDMFMFGMVSANKDNPPRKSFQHVLDAFVEFKKSHPNSGIFFHTLIDYPNGFPILEYAKGLGLADSIFYLDPYDVAVKLDQEHIAKLTNAFDCLLMPSTNEGFGIPAIEAQACGVPVITNNFTSMSELVKDGKTGYLTKTAFKRFSPLLSYVAHPDTQDLYQKMEAVFSVNRDSMGKAGRAFMKKDYDINKLVTKNWTPLLEEIEADVYGG